SRPRVVLATTVLSIVVGLIAFSLMQQGSLPMPTISELLVPAMLGKGIIFAVAGAPMIIMMRTHHRVLTQARAEISQRERVQTLLETQVQAMERLRQDEQTAHQALAHSLQEAEQLRLAEQASRRQLEQTL